MTGRRVTDQRSSHAGRDIIGGDQNVTDNSIHHHHAPQQKTILVDQLMAKLQKELDENTSIQPMIDDLQYYYKNVSGDGVDGLENKLEKAGRAHEVPAALEKKEMFAKLLDKWSMYASAQEIFVHLLARAEHEYTSFVLPMIGTNSEIEVNERISSRIVEPLVADCGGSLFRMNHGVAMGMVYWLAEQCFVRWHR